MLLTIRKKVSVCLPGIQRAQMTSTNIHECSWLRHVESCNQVADEKQDLRETKENVFSQKEWGQDEQHRVEARGRGYIFSNQGEQEEEKKCQEDKKGPILQHTFFATIHS